MADCVTADAIEALPLWERREFAAICALESLVENDAAALSTFHGAIAPGLVDMSAALENSFFTDLYHWRVRHQALMCLEDPRTTPAYSHGRQTTCRSPTCLKKSDVFSTFCFACQNTKVAPSLWPAESIRRNILAQREAACLRSLRYVRKFASVNNLSEDFQYHAGDIVFLFSHVAVRGTGPVAAAALALCSDFSTFYRMTDCSDLELDAHPHHILGWAEMLHADAWTRQDHAIANEVAQGRSLLTRCLAKQELRDIVALTADELAPTAGVPDTRKAGYCRKCGRYEKMSRVHCPTCKKPLQRDTDWEALTEAMVWTSLFAELGCAVKTCTLDQVFRFIPLLRPYGTFQFQGRDSYILMCYFITHLVYVASGWGAVCLGPHWRYFVEERLFLRANMNVVVETLKDPELVGEFVHALRILGEDDWSHPMTQGIVFLLETEEKGRFVEDGDPYRKRYHAAFCGIAGLAQWKFEEAGDARKFGWHLFRGMPECWRKYFVR